MSLFWKGNTYGDVKTIPVCLNTVQHPLPSPSRCYRLGQAIGRAIELYPKDLKVVILGTGGMSHQLDGERAGFINKKFDLMCMEKIVNAPEELAKISMHNLVKEEGAQGAELILWLTIRGALIGKVKKPHSNYHIAISNTPTGLMVLENTR